MPVVKTVEVNKHRILCIWHTTESFDKMLAQLSPSREDEALVRSFKSEKKRLEWLAGRLTLKHLAHLVGLDYNGLSKDEHGKPYLIGHKHEISLTHSHPYVAAIIDTKDPVGIDLEAPREKVLRIAHKYCSPEELQFANNDIQKLNILWSAKETLYKIYGRKGLQLKKHFLLQPFDGLDVRVITGSIIANDTIEGYKLACEQYKGYILTYNL